MSDPLIPNYKKSVGRLVTDRFDFQNHVDGTNFRHKSNQIDLSTNLVIDGYTKTNVQDALAALTVVVTPPTIVSATTLVKGIVQLAGDIGGVATNVVVKGIQQRPISSLAPNNGDVLTWSSGSGNWTPSSATFAFTAGGDLAGTNVSQTVSTLTGLSSTVTVLCPTISFNINQAPILNQLSSSSIDGYDMSIFAQTTTGVNKNGGNVIISGGAKNGSGQRGGVKLQINQNEANMLQLVEPTINSRVLSLLHSSNLTSSDMPANTGDMVVYIGNASTAPTSGNPSNGSILYGSSGTLRVKQSNGEDFQIGSWTNQNMWGDVAAGEYHSRDVVTVFTSGAAVTIFSYALPDNTAVGVDVVIIGKPAGAAHFLEYHLSRGYVRDGGGGAAAIGSLTTLESRLSFSPDTGPTITNSGNTLQIKTGTSVSYDITWVAFTKLFLSQG